MYEQEVEDSLRTFGSREDQSAVNRWLVIALGVALGETLSTLMLAVALFTMGRDWPGPMQIVVGVAWYALSVGQAIMFFRRMKVDLGRDHDPALPWWLLKGFWPFLAAPYLLMIPLLTAKQMPNPALRVGGVFLLSAPAWYGALAFYAAALWIRGCMTRGVELISFTPVNEGALPDKARAFFDSRQADFEDVGFELVGDFLQKPIEQQYARTYLGAGGKFVGETTCCESQNLQATSIFTLLADGKFVESADIALGGPTPRSALLFMQGKAGKTVREILARHGEFVQQLCADADTAPVSLSEEHIEAAARYGVWLTMQELVRQGVLESNPYDELAAEIRAQIQTLLPEPVGAA